MFSLLVLLAVFLPFFRSVLLLPLGFVWYTRFFKIYLFVSWKVFFSSPSIMSSNFISYFSLVWQLWSFTSWNVLFQALLDFKVSVGKSVLILIAFSLYATFYLCLSLAGFYSLSLFSHYMWCFNCGINGKFVCWPCFFDILCAFYICMYLLFLGMKILFLFLLTIWFISLTWDSFLPSISIIQDLLFSCYITFLACSILCFKTFPLYSLLIFLDSLFYVTVLILYLLLYSSYMLSFTLNFLICYWVFKSIFIKFESSSMLLLLLWILFSSPGSFDFHHSCAFVFWGIILACIHFKFMELSLCVFFKLL